MRETWRLLGELGSFGMTSITARVIQALRGSHRDLVDVASSLGPQDILRPSYCTEWSVAQVYSHLGSGAEIGRRELSAGLDATMPDREEIWRRWNALTPQAMIQEFVESDASHLDALEHAAATTVGPAVRMEGMRLDVGTVVLLRLAEHALHNWDIRVALNPAAEVDPILAGLLVDHYPLQFVSMIANPEVAGRVSPAHVRVDITEPQRTLYITVAGPDVQVLRDDTGTEATGHLRLPAAGVWARLLSGRLDPHHTPQAVAASGTPDLATIRSLFQGDL
jgi:uncharacterized protein (TIGR03083 family)